MFIIKIFVGMLIIVQDVNEVVILQERLKRRVRDLTGQVEQKEEQLERSRAQEERDLLESQKLKELQLEQENQRRSELYQETKRLNEMRGRMLKEHEKVLQELTVKDEELRALIDIKKKQGCYQEIYQLELDRLKVSENIHAHTTYCTCNDCERKFFDIVKLLFAREAGGLSFKQAVSAEELKVSSTHPHPHTICSTLY
jgi:hypothetical protein